MVEQGSVVSRGGYAYGEQYAEGDVIGMKLDMYRRELSYYRNGKCLGVAFTDLPQVKLYVFLPSSHPPRHSVSLIVGVVV